MQPNRREYKRYQVAVTAEIEVDGDTKIGETRDISLGGVSVSLDCQLMENSTVDLALILTEDGIEDPDEDPFEIKAKVIWSAPADEGQFMVGVRFVDLSDEKTAQLKRFVNAMANES
jgi:c-di-GMP-binding flagellar brake protein YcgR